MQEELRKKLTLKDRPSMFFDMKQNDEKRLKQLHDQNKATPKEKAEKEVMMAKASEFVENGIPFEMAPMELQNHHFFKVGYDVAVRRKKALESKGKGR